MNDRFERMEARLRELDALYPRCGRTHLEDWVLIEEAERHVLDAISDPESREEAKRAFASFVWEYPHSWEGD